MKIDAIDFTQKIQIPTESSRRGESTSAVNTKRFPKLEMEESTYGIQCTAHGHSFLVPWAHVLTVHYEPHTVVASKKKAV